MRSQEHAHYFNGPRRLLLHHLILSQNPYSLHSRKAFRKEHPTAACTTGQSFTFDQHLLRTCPFVVRNFMARETPLKYSHNSDGDKIIPSSIRSDGSIRPERRIREGYIPQDEQPTYKSKSALERRGYKSCPGKVTPSRLLHSGFPFRIRFHR